MKLAIAALACTLISSFAQATVPQIECATVSDETVAELNEKLSSQGLRALAEECETQAILLREENRKAARGALDPEFYDALVASSRSSQFGIAALTKDLKAN